MTEEKPTLFVRRASGLVRAWSPTDQFVFNVLQLSPVLSWSLTIPLAAYLFPGGNVVIAALLVAAFAIPGALVYALLGASMPRTGGDYIWQSRLLSPAYGFTFVLPWAWWIGGCTWIAFTSWACTQLIWTPGLIVMGFKDAGMWLFTPVGEITMAVVISIYCLIINMLGMKWYARIMKGWFILGVLGFITWMAIAAVSAQTTFVSGFNNWMQTYMGVGGNSFEQVISAAAGAGFNPTPAFSWWDTLLICPIVSFVLAWFGWPTFQLGEIRGMDSFKNQIYWIVLGTLTGVGISIGIYLAVTSITGMAFFNSVAYNFYNALGPLTIPPFYILFFATLTSNPWLMLWIILAANGFAWSWFAEFVLSPSRVIFAAAFDRVLPSWLASVKTRFRIPVNAMLLVTVTNILFAAVFFLWSAFSGIWLAATVWGLWVQLSTVLAGMVWPWRNRELFKTSIAGRFKVGGFPLITLLGIPYIIWTLFMLYLFLSPEYGGNYGTNSTASIIFLTGFGVVHLVFFYLYKWKNKRQGMDVDLIYKEIPVE